LGTTTYLVSRIYSADKKRLDALHHAESANKLAAIGRLASGVAHEINNPLAIINEKNGLLTDILSAQDNDEQQQKLLGIASDVNSAVRRCGRITKRLLDFARHLEPSIERVNVKEIVENIISFYLKEAERQNIRIRMDFPDQIPELETDKGSLQQIFLNLIENAFDALKNGGELNITAGVEDNYLKVIVADTGIGIPKDEHHKIFEPFYSSKSERWKTGLGLSITYGLIKEINADITVDSSVGKGAQFTLTLPLAANCENQ
jgi:two-component system NtrC family sensor kinase